MFAQLVVGRRSKKISKLRVTGIYAGNLLVTGESPSQKASNAEYVSSWWRHHTMYKNSSHYLYDYFSFINTLTEL